VTDPAEGPADVVEEPAQTVEVRLTAWSLAFVTLALLLAGAVFWLFGSATATITKIAIGIVLAVALDPLISALRRHGWSRPSAATAVGVGMLGLFGVVLSLLGPPAIDQAGHFQQELPQTVEEFYTLPLVGSWLEENDAADTVQKWVQGLPSSIDDQTVSDTVTSLVGRATSAVLVLAVAFAVMLDGEWIVGHARRLLPPSRRVAADRLGRIVYDTFGRYFAGSLTIAVLAGMNTLIIALVFDIPLAPVAAIWTMITNLIPQVGGFLGGAFLAILALSVSPWVAIGAVAWFVVYMNFENNVIQPAVIGRAVNLSPPTTMMAAFIGAAVAGVPGALVATPTVGVVKRLYFVFVKGQDNLASDGRVARSRRTRRRGRRRPEAGAHQASADPATDPQAQEPHRQGTTPQPDHRCGVDP
jgi:predicted PurR-regulated permease PerM